MTCVSSRENTNTLPRFLGVESHGVYISACWEYQASFLIVMASYTASCEALSRSFASDESLLPIPRVW